MTLFREAIEKISPNVSEETFQKFKDYNDLLIQWNRDINLISRHDETRIETRHFLESAGLMIAIQFIDSQRILDLGAGAGFPGIPIKLLHPDLKLTLVESRKKKALFLKDVVEKLCLEDVDVIPERVEDYVPDSTYDHVVSRAVADLSQLYKWSRHLLSNPGGQMVAMKGPRVHEEASIFRNKNPDIQCQVKPYNPFPDLYPLHDHFLGIVTL